MNHLSLFKLKYGIKGSSRSLISRFRSLLSLPAAGPAMAGEPVSPTAAKAERAAAAACDLEAAAATEKAALEDAAAATERVAADAQARVRAAVAALNAERVA